MRRRDNGMRPQDIVVLLKTIILDGAFWQVKNLASSLIVSNSDISESLARSFYAGLIDFDRRNVQRENLLNFLLYGMKYVFPAQLGVLTRGIPTAHSHPFMKTFISSEQAFVWPSSSGVILGQSIEPFYSN